MQCAVALDEVVAVFGTRFQPVVVSVETGPLMSGPVPPENIADAETLLTEILKNHFS